MTSTTEAAVRELCDRAAIHDVLMRYARGVDRRDLDLVAACFTADAAYDGTLAQGTIADALAALRGRLARYEHTMHFMGNQLIEVRGDNATCETYAVAYHRLSSDGPPHDLTVGIRYLDELVRQGEHWRIRRRVVQREWERTDAVVLPPNRNAPARNPK